MQLPFDNDIELTASTVCIITPPPLVRNIGEGRSGPQTVSAKTLYLRIRPSRYSITDLYIYTSCSAVAVIVVELRLSLLPCAHASMYRMPLLTLLYKLYHKHQNIICVIVYGISEQHFHLFNTYRLCSASESAIMLFFDIRFK